MVGLEITEETFKDFPNPPKATWLTRHASMTGYEYVEVWPARNATGEVLENDVTELITEVVRENLEEYGYTDQYGTDTPKKVLVVRLNLMSYEAGSGLRRMICQKSGQGAAQVTILAELLDKRYNKVIGEVVVDDDIRGCFWGLPIPGAATRIVSRASEQVAVQIHEKLNSF